MGRATYIQAQQHNNLFCSILEGNLSDVRSAPPNFEQKFLPIIC